MDDGTQLKSIFERYRTHPDFLGIDLTGVNQPGAVDDTIFHMAARNGSLEDIRALLAAGAQVNLVGDLGHTALHYAAMFGRTEIVRELLRNGADASKKNEFGETAADVAKSVGKDPSLLFEG